MKFHIISDFGNCLGGAIKLKSEGNEVALYIRDSAASSVGKNLVDRVHDWEFTPSAETVHVVDSTGFGAIADSLRLAGLPVVGDSLIADKFEMDRAFCKKVMREAGIPTPNSKFFTDWHAGEEFVRSNEGKRFAIKPGESLSGNLPSHVADKDYPTEDALGILDHYSRTFAGDPEYELQDFVAGVDLSTAGYFDGDDFLEPCYHTLEVKAVMDGERGGQSGCSGNIMWPCDDWVLKDTLRKLRDALRKYGYVGLFDVNCIVDAEQQKVYSLEATPRFGYDSEPAIFTIGLTQELGKFLSDFANGQAYEFPIKNGFTAGIRITIPPFPDDTTRAPAGLPVLGVSDKALTEWMWAYDLMKSSDGRLVTAGSYGLVGVVCAQGDDPRATMQEATDRAKTVKVSDAQYRLDLADTFMRDLGDLKFLKPQEKKAEGAPKKGNALFPVRG